MGSDRSGSRVRVLAAVALFVTSLLGCGSRTELGSSVSLGVDASAPDASTTCNGTTPIDPTSLPGAVPPCESGFEHPNVCCHAGPTDPTVCTESLEDPFHRCGCDALTFPDPRTCCSLANAADCEAPLGTADAAAGGYCSFPCGPGAYPVTEIDAGAGFFPACTSLPSVDVDSGGEMPNGGCVYCCVNESCASDISFCGAHGCGPLKEPCGDCPAGWENVSGIPDLCCSADAGEAGDAGLCFSQAAVIVMNAPSL